MEESAQKAPNIIHLIDTSLCLCLSVSLSPILSSILPLFLCLSLSASLCVFLCFSIFIPLLCIHVHAKSRQSCPTLWKAAMLTTIPPTLLHVRLFGTPWTVALQAPLSMGFSRQEYWSGLLCPPPGDLPAAGMEPEFLVSPALAGGFFSSATWEAPLSYTSCYILCFRHMPFFHYHCCMIKPEKELLLVVK